MRTYTTNLGSPTFTFVHYRPSFFSEEGAIRASLDQTLDQNLNQQSLKQLNKQVSGHS